MGNLKGRISGLLFASLLAACGTSSVDPLFSPMGGEVIVGNQNYTAANDPYRHSDPPTVQLPPWMQPQEYRTVIELLTPTIINNAANQFLQFKVSYENPAGNPTDFPFDELLFDMASISVTGVNPLPYTVTVSNSVVYDGMIDTVRGTDLFGNVGTNYFHYATDRKLDIPAGVQWFIFSVDLSHTVNHPYGTRGTPPPSEQISVYVRLGHDSLVATTPVTFLNQ